MAFLKREKLYQAKYEAAIKKLIRIALLVEKIEAEPSLVLTFDNGLPKDWQYDVSVWGEARAQGLASKETAVAMFQGIEGDELTEELDRIGNEDAQAMTKLLAETEQQEEKQDDNQPVAA
jgi:hypothetical protein